MEFEYYIELNADVSRTWHLYNPFGEQVDVWHESNYYDGDGMGSAESQAGWARDRFNRETKAFRHRIVEMQEKLIQLNKTPPSNYGRFIEDWYDYEMETYKGVSDG